MCQSAANERIQKAIRNTLALPLLIFLVKIFVITWFETQNQEEYPHLKGTLFTYLLIYFAVCYAALLGAANLKDEEALKTIALKGDDLFFKKIIDAAFLGNHQIFKNSTRNNAELRTIFCISNISLCISTLIFCFALYFRFLGIIDRDFILECEQLIQGITDPKILITGVTGAFSITGGVYLKIQSNYKARWEYCANVYYKLSDVLTSHAKTINCEPEVRDACHNYRIAVAIDVLQHDLWAKRGFESFFKESLKFALDCPHDNIFTKSQLIDLKEKIEGGRCHGNLATEKEIETILKNSFKGSIV